MGQIRTLGLATAVAGTPVPVVLAAAGYPGVVVAAVGFSISKGICTVTLNTATFPKNGYNGPNGYPTQNATTGSKFDIQGNWPAPNGQLVTLWGFTTTVGLLLNGKRVSVLDCNPATKTFRFYFNHADDLSAGLADTGNTAPSPAQHYRVIRLECSQALSTDLVYVGDGNVSSTQYMAALSLAGQLSIEIASENIPPEGLFIDGTNTGDAVQVTVVY